MKDHEVTSIILAVVIAINIIMLCVHVNNQDNLQAEQYKTILQLKEDINTLQKENESLHNNIMFIKKEIGLK